MENINPLAFPRLWKSLLQQVEQAVAAAQAGSLNESLLHQVMDRLSSMENQPALPRAAWKKLIMDIEVWHSFGPGYTVFHSMQSSSTSTVLFNVFAASYKHMFACVE